MNSGVAGNIVEQGTRILVMTAVAAEREAIMRGLQQDRGRMDVQVAGVGVAAAAASTMKLLVSGEYGLVISAGIGGGFVNKTEVGMTVVASEIIAADLGAETQDGFRSVDTLGFGSTRVTVDGVKAARISQELRTSGLLVVEGPILTVSTVTGTAETAAELANRVPGAVAEAMEGYGVAIAAQQCGVPVLEIRTISNLVGPRDRDAWRIQEALDELSSVSTVLQEVLG